MTIFSKTLNFVYKHVKSMFIYPKKLWNYKFSLFSLPFAQFCFAKMIFETKKIIYHYVFFHIHYTSTLKPLYSEQVRHTLFVHYIEWFTISNVICLVNPQNGSWVLFTIVWNSLYWGSLYQGLSALGKHKAPVRNRKYKLRNAISIFKNALMFNCLFTKDHPPSDSEVGIMCFPNL